MGRATYRSRIVTDSKISLGSQSHVEQEFRWSWFSPIWQRIRISMISLRRIQG